MQRPGLGGGLDNFLKTVFNYPTLAEGYKTAAFHAANKLALISQARACVSATSARDTGNSVDGGGQAVIDPGRLSPFTIR